MAKAPKKIGRPSKRTPEVESAFIYGLYDPRTNELRYIGKANHPQRRLAGHLRECRRRRTPVYDWMRSLDATPIMLVIEHAADWREAEGRLIAAERAKGTRLLNLADGGDEPKCSDDVRSRNAQRLNERIRTDPKFRKLRDAKRMLSAGLRAGSVRNQTRAIMRELAALEPKMFGEWATLKDREEDESGEPVGGYGRLRIGRYGALQADA